MNAKQTDLLKSSVGKHVRILNEADEQMTDGKVHIHAHGKLESCEDDGSYYVRINEDPQGHGCNGIGFWPANIIDCERAPSGITVIVLK